MHKAFEDESPPLGGKSRARLAPAQTLLVAYVLLVFAGASLLSLPAATSTGISLPFVDALFMSTSAVSITGLSVVDPAHDLSILGQVILMCLVQVGAVGIMTMSTLFVLLLGRKVRLKDRLFLRQDLNYNPLAGIVRLVREVVLLTLVIEAVGAVLLYFALPNDMQLGRAAYVAVFHSISAFANGGFDLFGDSLQGRAVGVPFGLVTVILFVLGGLGFGVLQELHAREKGLSLASAVALKASAWLLGIGTLLVLMLEWTNGETFGGMSTLERVWHAFFLSATTRSGGFSTVPTAALGEATLFVCIVLMFIGASPGSTGGGIKTTTAATIGSGVISTIKGQRDVVIGNRRLPSDAVHRALTIVILSALVLIAALFILLIFEGTPFLSTLFELVSAFGTVGLSTGIAPTLSPAGKAILMLMMVIGRIGPLTVAFALAGRESGNENRYRLPEERIPLG